MLCKASSCRKPSLRAFHGLLGVMRGDIHIWMSASLHHGNARKNFLVAAYKFFERPKSRECLKILHHFDDFFDSK